MAAAALLALGCDAAAVRLGGPRGIAGGTGGGGGGASSSVVGNWRNIYQTILTTGELLVVETRWRFGAGGDCSTSVIQTFVDRGEQFTDGRFCTYQVGLRNVVITYDNSIVPVQFQYGFQGPNLVLDGFVFIPF